MRRFVMVVLCVLFIAVPVDALEITAPEVPQSGMQFMPSTTETFGQGFMEVLTDALGYFVPAVRDACAVCGCVVAAVILISLVGGFSEKAGKTAQMIGAMAVAAVLLESSGGMISMASETVQEVSSYGKLLLPVMTTALAAQGGVTASAALYAGTAAFDAVLSGLISRLLTPLIYIYLALATVNGAIGEEMLKKLRDTLKGFMTWVLKTVLYVFTGYIGVTGVVSGTTDASILKAAKLTISGAVPVVGGILSDASEAVMVSISTVKNAAGLYGLFAIIAMVIGPFLEIGAQYLVLKITAAVCGIFGSKEINGLIGDFSTAMGFLLAMTGAVSVMQLISTICFLKGVG